MNMTAINYSLLESQGIYLSESPMPKVNKTVFLFTGHGSQYPNMLKQLAEIHPVVKDTLNEADEVYKKLTGKKLTDLIFYDDEERKLVVEKKMLTAEVMQPSIIMANIAIYRLMKTLSREVDFHLGHSLGEVAALAAADVVSFADALKIAYYRAISLNKINRSARGSMISLKASRESAELKRVLEGIDDYYIISLHNSPDQVVISGTLQAIDKIAANSEVEKVTCNKLAVSHAFHSKLLEPAVKYYHKRLLEFTFQPPKVKVFSTILGDFYNDHQFTTETMASLLSSQLVQPFSFCDIVSRLHEEHGANLFIEVGPKDILTKLVKNILNGKQIYAHASNVAAVGDEASLERVIAYLTVNKLVGPSHEEVAFEPKVELSAGVNQTGVEETIKAIVQLATGYPLHYISISAMPVKLELALTNQVFKTIIEKIRAEFVLDEHAIPLDDNISLRTIASTIRSKLGLTDADQLSVLSAELKSAVVLQKVELRQPTVEAGTASATVASNTSAISNSEVEVKVKEIIQVKTGYPVEMLEGELDLEADLGIDSVKQAEIFVQIREAFDYEVNPDLNIKQFNTIYKIVEYTLSRLEESKVKAGSGVGQASISSTPAQPAISLQEVETQVKKIIQVKTGYPVEMLEGELDLEADLGIDSVKQAEIFVQIREAFDYEVNPDLNIKQFNTIHKIIAYTLSRLEESKVEAGSDVLEASISAAPVQPAFSQQEVEAQVKRIVQVKTGYPVEMLEGELDLEADLGIDSVKQAEIFVQIREIFGYEVNPDLNIKQFNTIHKIVAYTISRIEDNPSSAVETKSKELTDEQLYEKLQKYSNAQVTLRYVPVTVEREYDEADGRKFLFKGKSFIVIEDRLGGEVTAKLTDMITHQGAEVSVISPDPERYGAAGIRTDFANLERFKKSLEEAKDRLKDVHGFIYLYPLSQEFSYFDSEDEQWAKEVDNNFNLLFYTAKAVYESIEKHGLEAGCFAATNIGGVFGIEKETSFNPLGALTTGFFKSMEKEVESFSGKVVDLTDSSNSQHAAEILLQEFSLIEEL
ncbi:MAG: acyltransferase domain-containing protein, partial [Gorillibacterium sp.]|nr:acyltransferase domain-containing protein [Gorillibacterium sp.]